jgi:hypothetical protein
MQVSSHHNVVFWQTSGFCNVLNYRIKRRTWIKVFGHRVLRRIFVPEREEVTGGWRKLNIVELHNLYSSTNIRVTKSRRMRWVGHAARMKR